MKNEQLKEEIEKFTDENRVGVDSSEDAVQKLLAHNAKYLIVADECHRLRTASTSRVLRYFKNKQ